MKHMLFFAFTFCLAVGVAAQEITLKGNVQDSSFNEPLPGVNVVVKNSSNGAVTDFDGNYTLNKVSVGDVVAFSYLGFVTKEVTVLDGSDINIILIEDVSALDEVVVVGYGTQTKKEVTGAVAVVGAESIEKLNPTRIEQALQGQVSGVNITSASGAPGSGLNIRIRGISTNGDSRPLILVDGNPIEDLSVINPNDIESINVLKDATAGIYGVRGANGVILIVTKSGRKNGKLNVVVNSYTGLQQTSKKIDLLAPRDYAIYVNQASINGGGRAIYTVYPETGIDWQDTVFETATISDTNFSINGGTEKLAYSFSSSYLDQDGIVGSDKSGYKRATARVSLQYDLLQNLKLSGTAIYTRSKKNNLPEGGIGSVLYSAVNIDPYTPVYDPENTSPTGGGYGETLVSAREIVNPIALIDNTYNTTVINKISGTFGADYTIVDGLVASSKFLFNRSDVQTDTFQPVFSYDSRNNKQGTIEDDPDIITDGNRLGDFLDIYEDYTWDNFITYSKIFNDKHNLKVLLGTSIFNTQGRFTGRSGVGLINDRNSIEDAIFSYVPPENINNRFTEEALLLGADTFESRLQSIFSRVEYNYKEKYLLSILARRDGSSAFGPRNKFGYFPVASIGWNVSEEGFFKDNKFFNYLKLRASYGIIGNDRIQGERYLSLLNGQAIYTNNDETNDEDILTGVAIGGLSNPEIRWEKQETGNIGIDAKFFDNSLSISADVFSRKTEDLLVQASVSGILGAEAPGSSAPIINAGSVENSGVEFLIGYDKQLTDNFKINLSYNFSTLKNEVLFVGSTEGFLQGGSFLVGENLITSRMEKGFPIGYFYGYETDGIYQDQAEITFLDAASSTGSYHTGAQPGDLKFVDVNGDGTITEEDKTYIGDPIPDMTMGLNLGFSYKNFDFSSSAFASLGNDLVRDYERKNLFANRGTYVTDAWTPENPSNVNPRAISGNSVSYSNFSDYFVEDASYVRIQNVQLGYTFGEKQITSMGLDKLRLYVSANNLHTFSNYRGYDPSAIGGGTNGQGEPIGSGVDKGYYPVAKTFLFGINLNF